MPNSDPRMGVPTPIRPRLAAKITLLSVLMTLLPGTGVGAAEPPTRFFATPVLRGGDAPQAVRVQVAGWTELCLIVQDAGDYSHDVANWAEARLRLRDGREIWLDTLEPRTAEQAWGRFQRDNRSAVGGPLQIADRPFARGRGTPAQSHHRYAHPADAEWFEAQVGVDASRAAGEGSVRFVVADRPEVVPPAPQETPGPGQLVLELEALRLAIEDLQQTFGLRYPQGSAFLGRTERLGETLRSARVNPTTAEAATALATVARDLAGLREEALLANPLLDFDRLLLVRRRTNQLGLPQNWQGNSSLPARGYDNEIAVLSPVRPGGRLTTVHRPAQDVFVGDVELHYDADRLMYSSLGSHGRWQVFELPIDPATGMASSGGPRELKLTNEPDVDHYDACYLPDGRIIFCGTSMLVGVPCVDGSDHVANLFLHDPAEGSVRQLTFDQDHDWSPVMQSDGRVLYQRWEYADTPHSNTRLLFRMNPDGTTQEEFYGSNSYWPNSMFYARPIPGHPTRVVAIATGHHGVPRMGELVILDPARGRREAAGAVQRIPGRGRSVDPVIKDNLVDASWPKFLHPFPLSEKYFLVSAKPTASAAWGVYLVDVFDNLVRIADAPGQALLEPLPLRRTPRPPLIPDRVQPGRQDAVVYLADIYQGEGLRGVPRGTVKALRVFAYHWSYQGMGGLLGTIGLDGPWDIRRILGTVPVESDGSAYFRVPANTPIAVQPLDGEGCALQLMRSWFTAMPGENLSCVGCHERQNSTPSVAPLSAFRGGSPREIEPWHGPARGFGYRREVQPVIDRHCIECHDGEANEAGTVVMDLRGTENIRDFAMVTPGHAGQHGGKFSVGYANLHRFVRRPGIESDYHLLTPLEYHAGTTELVQLLRQGHHGIQLGAEDWDRLFTWIDLNAPYHGSWSEEIGTPGLQIARRRELRKRYAGMDDDDAETLPPAPAPVTPAVRSAPEPATASIAATPAIPVVAGWPFDAAEAVRRQQAAGPHTTRRVDLGDGVMLELVLVPAGSFVPSIPDPGTVAVAPVRVERAFWMARCETDNAQFARFDPAHDSRVESKMSYQFGIHGLPMNQPRQPVVRVSWEQAMAFCQWLGARAGETFTLPTEGQWEWACRSGAATPFAFGDLASDFSAHANLADVRITDLASDPYTVWSPLTKPTRYDDYTPRDSRFDDGQAISAPTGSYRPNAWGVHDLHGNVWEWTRSGLREGGDADSASAAGVRVVRGGSWYDRPPRATASYRLAYPPWQKVFNVGFRVIAESSSSQALGRGPASLPLAALLDPRGTTDDGQPAAGLTRTR